MREEFMITRQGKQYVLFAGLLDEAHSRGLKGIDTELIQVPTAENGNTAIVKATVEMEDSRVFGGIGDASPDNVGRNIAPHIIRMAETRAKARALRDAVNVGSTALEELSDGDEAPQAPSGNYQSRGSSRPAPIREARQPSARPRPVEEAPPVVEPESESSPSSSPQDNGQSIGEAASSGKVRKSQVDLLKTLISEARGPDGLERMEKHLGKPVTNLTREEADSWIDRLTPAEDRD
ncbi:MAG: hypothetical protein ACR2KW_09815 [Rubrobacter sp.]